MHYLIFIEAIVFGIITLIIGTIIFNLTINKNNKHNIKPFGINIAFFATGFFVNIIFEIIGSNEQLF
jgi:hypothetical protein